MAKKQDGRTYTDAENCACFAQELNGNERCDSVIEEAQKECKVGKPTPNKCKIQTIHLTFMTKANAKDRETLNMNMHAVEDKHQKQKLKGNQNQKIRIVENAKDNHVQEKTHNAKDANCMDTLEQTATFSTEYTGVYNTLVKIHLKQS